MTHSPRSRSTFRVATRTLYHTFVSRAGATLLVILLLVAVVMLAVSHSLAQSDANARSDAAEPPRPLQQSQPVDIREERPRIEVCFVLDTTGSMSGLIEGAKRKIWSIANQIATTKPAPELKLGLVGYRDRGDAYITVREQLTDDLDAVYAKLMSFKADGGGDGPESVNQALHEAVHKMTWSKDRDVLKIIFLVGDYPPHMDYEQDVKYPITCKQAMEKDLIINTIQCGNHAPTTPIWQEIARLSEGTYASIGQSGDMVAVATPMDDKIAELNRRLADTVVPYGDVTVQTTTAGKISAIKAAPAEAAADRASYAESTGLLGGEAGRRSVVTGADDVVSQLAREEITEEDLDKLEAEKLPDDLKKLSTEKRKQVIQERLEQRKKLQKQLDELIVQRRDYLKKRIKEREAEQRDSFDAQIAETIQKQAARKGIEYDEKEKPARD